MCAANPAAVFIRAISEGMGVGIGRPGSHKGTSLIKASVMKTMQGDNPTTYLYSVSLQDLQTSISSGVFTHCLLFLETFSK